MKKSIYSLVLVFVSLFTEAADLKVDKTGSISGSYTTITAAITAASNGDRIVVYNQGGNYYENLTIDKSLTIFCALEGEYFYVNGDVTFTPANGREITLIGMRLMGNMLSGGTNPVGARCLVSVVDCEINGEISIGDDGYNFQLLYSMVTEEVHLRYGKLIANIIGREAGDQGILGRVRVTAELSSYGTGDTLFIIANRISKSEIYSINHCIQFDNPNLRYFIANNSIRGHLYSSTGYTVARTPVNIINCYLADSANTFINNYCQGYEGSGGCNTGTTYGCVQLKGIKNENFCSNILRNKYGAGGSAIYGCGALGMRGDYNYYDGYRTWPTFATDDNFSWASATTSNINVIYDAVTGQVTGGTYGFNTGRPGVAFMDIDLTRNDVGPWGGPYTQANYWNTANPQGGRARVFLLSMPSAIFSLTTPVTIKANATHTK